MKIVNYEPKKFDKIGPSCAIKICVLCSKLMCLSKPVQVTHNSKITPAYNKICHFSVDYKASMFLVQSPIFELKLKMNVQNIYLKRKSFIIDSLLF
jgi:hypothetical protein